MTHVSMADLVTELERADSDYLEVLSVDSMRVELARYPNPEPTHPHDQDELYVIQSGSGVFRVGTETHAVEPGDVVYVEQGLDHEFVEIDDEVTALIVFPAASEPTVLHDR